MGARKSYQISARAQAITLKVVGLTNKEISEQIGCSVRQVQKWYAAAIQRGYNPSVSKLLKDEYIQDLPRSGRPSKRTEAAVVEVNAKTRFSCTTEKGTANVLPSL